MKTFNYLGLTLNTLAIALNVITLIVYKDLIRSTIFIFTGIIGLYLCIYSIKCKKIENEVEEMLREYSQYKDPDD